MDEIRHDWTLSELSEIYHRPLIELISQAHTVYLRHFLPGEAQVNSLISVKTGGCPEDCKYCGQSSRYKTPTSPQAVMELEEVLRRAKEMAARGATRICLGVAQREVRDGLLFDRLLEMVKAVTALGLEVCCTMGMLQPHQAEKLKEAGLYAYNHNLDSSERFYKTIITTRTYQERLQTLDVVQEAGLSVCCGGIIGMGETVTDRLELLQNLSSRRPHPDSVPINRLGPVRGTPLENQEILSPWEVIRTIATARIIMPRSWVRISAGREGLPFDTQALYFLAGANSLFLGDILLTIPNAALDADQEMFQLLGLKLRRAFA